VEHYAPFLEKLEDYMSVVLVKMTESDYNDVTKKLDFSDAGEEILSEIRNRSSNLYSTFECNNLVGAALVEEGKRAYLYIFIDPAYRSIGIGSKTLLQCEQIIENGESEQILTSYNSCNPVAKSFATKFGYKKKFASNYMEFSGPLFDIPELSIRDYCSNDYEMAHRLSAVAFHEMRLSTGSFPESVIEETSEKMRIIWSETANERLLYIHNDEIIGHAQIAGNEIDSVSVKSEYQGIGVGRNFVKYLCNKIIKDGHTTVSLYCVVGNGAMKLYESLGFKVKYTAEFALKSRG
jgi:mycothiol synthase